MLTPQKIQDLADPIESIYIAMTNELMVNIGRHITSPNWTHTAAWEIQKLSELGQLTAENAAIINNWIAQIPNEIRDTMEETRRIALEGIEQDLSKAADKGYLTPPMRDSTYDVLNEYGQQAADKLNMVNTTMLESSVEMYKRGIAMVMSEEQAAAAQNILNEETGAVVSGTETRTQALQRAIGRMNDEGITGFYDRAGRSWSAEAYVNMDIRTTVHNTAIQSVKNRMNDYGAQVFQVSAHAGARPLCYPYQGKMFSWDNTAGEIEDGNGKTWKYAPLNSTSYGQAAGLFGVNCGHSPIPIIPGVSIPHAQDYVQPKSENDKAYAESQEQRALERKIRSAKRAIEMGDDSPEAKQRLKDAQKEMRQFIDETGRTRRYDRESLYSGKKAPTPPADQRPTPEERNNNRQNNQSAQVNKVQPPPFTPAKTREEAEQFARDHFVDESRWGAAGVSYEGVDVGVANRINKTLNELYTEFDVPKFGGIIAPRANTREGRMVQGATAGYTPVRHSFYLNRKSLKTEKVAQAHFDEERRATEDVLAHPEKYNLSKASKLFQTIITNARQSGRTTLPENIEETIYHEFGHSLEKPLKNLPNFQALKDRKEMFDKNISGYATTDFSEYIAESFCAWRKGLTGVDPEMISAFEKLRRA